MNSGGSGGGDVYKVWEIKTNKRLPREQEARKFLEAIAKAVQPIMHNHKWSVKLLSEFCNKRYLGYNIGGGQHVKLCLRRLKWDWEWDHWKFLPFDEVLDTMLHDLCHNVHGPRHNAAFYKLLDQLTKEYAELRPKGIPGFGNRFDLPGNTWLWKQEFNEFMAEGIPGFGNWFDLPGRRLGGYSPQHPFSAAEKWSQVGSLLPSGPRPKRLGGDIVTMEALSPAQAAAMAAERRLQDNIWCGCEHSDHEDEDVSYESAENIVHKRKIVGSTKLTNNSTLPWDQVSQKRSRSKDLILPIHSSSASMFIDLTEDEQEVGSITQHRNFGLESVSDSQFNSQAGSSSHSEEPAMWECPMCTLLNMTSASICEFCDTQQPKDVTTKVQQHLVL
ncbi:uncharacterized protein LOC130723732 [Lotus japonicus]|uniref:uncharacterized protein LOC130723732 n=1 Tax=Lotus japonicus TaxID=34305 RepID=UPI002589F0BC|nr:uncharacterized protein LOC130723732 [Lotus japonicus]